MVEASHRTHDRSQRIASFPKPHVASRAERIMTHAVRQQSKTIARKSFDCTSAGERLHLEMKLVAAKDR